MVCRIVHVSDLHVGRHDVSEPYAALHELCKGLGPELLVVTGDLSHRGLRSQFEQARSLLQALEVPVLAVPGNHDVPYTFPARFRTTFDEWEHVLGPTEPEYASDELAVVGLNSVRPWLHQGGALEASQLARAASVLEQARAGAVRVAVLHHHLAAPPWRAARKRPLRNRDQALRSFADAGVELVLGGHVHQAAVAERREFEVLGGESGRSLVLATAPGFSRVRPRRSGEAFGFNAIEADAETLAVVTHAWDGERFDQVGRRSFSRL